MMLWADKENNPHPKVSLTSRAYSQFCELCDETAYSDKLGSAEGVGKTVRYKSLAVVLYPLFLISRLHKLHISGRHRRRHCDVAPATNSSAGTIALDEAKNGDVMAAC